MKFYNYHK